MNENEYLMYCDSGAMFVNQIDPVIELMEKHNNSIGCFVIHNHKEL